MDLPHTGSGEIAVEAAVAAGNNNVEPMEVVHLESSHPNDTSTTVNDSNSNNVTGSDAMITSTNSDHNGSEAAPTFDDEKLSPADATITAAVLSAKAAVVASAVSAMTAIVASVTMSDIDEGHPLTTAATAINTTTTSSNSTDGQDSPVHDEEGSLFPGASPWPREGANQLDPEEIAHDGVNEMEDVSAEVPVVDALNIITPQECEAKDGPGAGAGAGAGAGEGEGVQDSEQGGGKSSSGRKVTQRGRGGGSLGHRPSWRPVSVCLYHILGTRGYYIEKNNVHINVLINKYMGTVCCSVL